MKVITRGVLPSEQIHRITCSTCNSELEFTRAEGTITRDQRDGDFITVTCPVCDKKTSADLFGSTIKS